MAVVTKGLGSCEDSPPRPGDSQGRRPRDTRHGQGAAAKCRGATDARLLDPIAPSPAGRLASGAQRSRRITVRSRAAASSYARHLRGIDLTRDLFHAKEAIAGKGFSTVSVALVQDPLPWKPRRDSRL